MARSEDPTTYSQAWQDVQQGYPAHDPNTPQAQPSYGAPQQPVSQAPAGYAPQYQNTYDQAAHDPATQAVQPEAYPALDPQSTGYAPVAEQNYAAPDPYASVDYTGQAPAQAYQPAPAQQEVAAQAYQPAAYDPAPAPQSGYRYADHTTQPAQGYAAEPQPHTQTYEPQTYQEPTQSYAAPEPQAQQQTYAEYAPAEATFAPAQDPYAQPSQYGGAALQQETDTFGQHEPMIGGVEYGHAPQPQEPTLGAGPQTSAYQDFAPQPQFADPQTQNLGHAHLGGGQAEHDAGVLDTSMFTQPGDFTQPAAHAGAALAGGNDFGFQTQPAAQQTDFGQQPADPHAGYDQRFQPQPQGYDQRFEQPIQGQYDGGLVGDISPQLGHESAYAQPGQEQGLDMQPVIAEQQVESSRSRRGLIVVGALVAAVGIGGGLGFAYKYSNDGSRTAAGTPPTIKASRTAAKQAPKATTGQNSFSSDAFAKRLESNRAARKSTTRVVSREEPLAGNGTSGVSLRSSTSGQTNAGGTRVTALQGQQTGNRANVPGVRRVKTLKVNPDGTFAVPSTRTTVSGDDALSISGVSLGSIPKARPVKAKRIDVAKAIQANRKSAATLPKLAAKVPKPKPAPAPKAVARLQPASTTAGGNGLGFVVQVSARRSRIDALAAFADLQQRYTGALSAKQPDIQEVNLGGTRGKWYRVRIGPPGSKNAAYNLCNRLKKSGLKDCLIKAY